MSDNSNINMFTPFTKYAQFDGRSSRKEFWLWVLLSFIVGFVMNIAAHVAPEVTIIPSLLWLLASLIPGIAVSVRRLHDTGRSGWNLFLALIPIVGPIMLLVFYLMESQPGSNKYGANPYNE